MTLDHDAIFKAYPNVTYIDDTDSLIKDADGKDVVVEQSKIDAARVELDNEAAASAYQRSRTGEEGETDTIYLPIQEQLDYLFLLELNK